MIISSIYAITAVLLLLLLAAYFFTIKKKEVWFFVLFTAIFVVNAGYFGRCPMGKSSVLRRLSVSAAIHANDYLSDTKDKVLEVASISFDRY